MNANNDSKYPVNIYSNRTRQGTCFQEAKHVADCTAHQRSERHFPDGLCQVQLKKLRTKHTYRRRCSAQNNEGITKMCNNVSSQIVNVYLKFLPFQDIPETFLTLQRKGFCRSQNCSGRAEKQISCRVTNCASQCRESSHYLEKTTVKATMKTL